MILLVSSNRDIASQKIKQQILSDYRFKQTTRSYQENPLFTAEVGGKQVILATLEQESVTAQNLPQDFPDAELVVFISRHSSQSGLPTLSVHTPGNLGAAEFGGLPKTVSVSPARAMQTALKTLLTEKYRLSLNYEVSYECTHHGPSLAVPAMFVELGSSIVQWGDLKGAEAVANAAMAVVADFSKPTVQAVLGIGGTHYNQKFTHMALAGEAVFGHMIAKYAVSQVDAELLKQSIQRTLEHVSGAVLDWKGIKSEDKPGLLSALDAVGLAFMKV